MYYKVLGMILNVSPPWLRYWILKWAVAHIQRGQKRWRYWQDIERQCQIILAYDGALGQPRDSVQWQRLVWHRLTQIMGQRYPLPVVMQAMLDNDETPRLLRWRVVGLMKILQARAAVRRIPKRARVVMGTQFLLLLLAALYFYQL